jgi:hypothetical protein
MLVILVVFYMFTRLAGYLVGPRISRGARKLVRTPLIILKKKNIQMVRFHQEVDVPFLCV